MPLQPPAPILISDRFPALLHALLDLLESLSEADWQRPTVAVGWSVKDIALHLLGDELGQLSWRRDRFSDFGGSLDNWDELIQFINRRNALWVEATRRLSVPVLLDWLRHAGEEVNIFLAAQDPFALGGAVDWAGSQPAPVWLDIAREFTERWHHQQHIRAAVGKPGCTEAYFLQPVLAAFIRGLPRVYREVSAAPGTCVTVQITGEAGGVWSVRREANAWQLYEGQPEQPNASVQLSQEIAWRLFTRGVDKAEARAAARLRGDLALAETALETISILA